MAVVPKLCSPGALGCRGMVFIFKEKEHIDLCPTPGEPLAQGHSRVQGSIPRHAFPFGEVVPWGSRGLAVAEMKKQVLPTSV